MYEIIMTWSVSWSGNLSGALVVSISNAMTTGSARATRSCKSRTEMSPALAETSYQSPTRMSVKLTSSVRPPQSCAGCTESWRLTLVDGDSEVVRHVVLANIENRILRVHLLVLDVFDEASATTAAHAPGILHINLHRSAAELVRGRFARDDFGIGVDRVEHLAVLVGEGEEVSPDGEEVGLVPERERDVLAAVAHEVIRLRTERASVSQPKRQT